jgi:hypothetical protein
MSYAQFTFIRFLLIPVALLFAVDWLLLPASLRKTEDAPLTVQAEYGTYKIESVVYLRTEDQGELRIPCTSAGTLCKHLGCCAARQLTVWLQKPSLLHRPWVVAATERERAITGPEDTASEYAQLKVVFGGLALGLIAMAFVAWYFGPFERVADDAR